MAVLNQVLVGKSEIKVIQGKGVLSCIGQGCCIGLIAFDAEVSIAGMIHIMLPEAFKDRPVDKLGKFANTGIPELIKIIEKEGGNRRRLKVAYAGGAQFFTNKVDTTRTFDIGARNADAVERILQESSIQVLASDTGGTSGRTISLDVETGLVTVRSVQGAERTICNLRGT